MKRKTALALSLLCGGAMLAASPALASVEEFYKGRVATLIVSSGGGSYTAIARILAKYMKARLPGSPTFIVKNMPGAGHVRATNFMYNNAPKDGSHIATIGSGIPLHQALDGKGVRYDVRKFNWLGTMGISNQMAIVWHKSGVRTIDDAKKKEVIVGGTGIGAGSVIFPTVLNNLVGTRFKLVIGYTNANNIDLAMERGEVDSRHSYSYGSFRLNHPTWEKEGKISFLYQVGIDAGDGVKGVPLMTELTDDPAKKKVLELMTYPSVLGRSYLAPPGVQADRLAALRAAFAASSRDKGFIGEMNRRGLDLYPADWQKVTALVNRIVDTPRDVIERAKQALVVKNSVECKAFTDPKKCGKRKKKKRKKKK